MLCACEAVKTITRRAHLQLVQLLLAAVEAESSNISRVAAALADLDVCASLAELAERSRFVRPQVDNSLSFEIRGGRHPVVENALSREGGGGFIPNDCNLILLD